MNNQNESFLQKPVNDEQEKINSSINMISHHIGTFLLISRVGDAYYNQTELAKSISCINELRLVLNAPEQLKKLDEFVEKINAVDVTSPKDDKILDEIQQLLYTNIKSLKRAD